MVQVDVFWSYGLGAGFALAAARQLRLTARDTGPGRTADNVSTPGAADTASPATASPADTASPATTRSTAGTTDTGDTATTATTATTAGTAGTGGLGWLAGDRYLTATLLYLGALFAPSGIWLLWEFPSWETMHAGDRSLPAWLVAAFAATNVTQGVLGFAVTRYLLLRGRDRLAYLQLVLAYFGMFFLLVHGWDGTGYRRFFSATRADYSSWPDGAALDAVRAWLTSPVALTLYGMGLVLVPVLLGVTARWHVAGLRMAAGGGRAANGAAAANEGDVRRGHPAAAFVLLSLASIFGLALGGAIAASVLVHLLGWALGAATSAVLAAAALLPRYGPAGRIATRMAG